MEQNLKARDSFVANITHELRTPVNGIKGHVKNLLDLETEPSKKSTLGIIIQCCNNMEKIINNLLDFSKMEAGKFEICEKPFEFKAVSIRRWIPTGQWQIRKGCIFMRL